jgi:hypothetical protein
MDRIHEETIRAHHVVVLGQLGGQVTRQSQKEGKQVEWPQGRPGQKPQEDACRQAQCTAASARTVEVKVDVVMMRIFLDHTNRA